VKKEVSPPKQKSMSSDDGSEEDTDFFPTLPTPKAPESIKWKDACLKSRAHSKYHSSYNFEKYKSYEAENGIAAMWIKAKPFGAWCRTNPQVIAIDCEMCETTCPLTGKIDGKALCRLSVINASNPEDILIDTLVKPDWPISDYRTRIHGIEPSHLDSVQFTLKHAQTFMMALCSEETVIIGHAVHNDLAALKMEHYCVADSSFLFEIKDEIGVCPSLRDVAMRVLSLEMPNIHDSVNDARISLQCLEEGYMKKGGSPSPIERYYPLRDRSVSKNNDSSLLVHRIPKICKVIHIQQLFLSQTSIQPEDIPEIEFAADKGKVMVTFQSPAHAKLAFEFISGVSSRDKGDKLQKKVYLKNGDYIVVRENCASKNPVGAE
jgi:RNA exonuclease 1